MTPKKNIVLRLLQLPKECNFFLFGARNTGKSTLLRLQFPKETPLWIDLFKIHVS